MSVRARISKPVGTPDIARSNTPLSVDTRARERERRRGTPPLVYYTHREPPLRGLCCLRFFQTGSTPPREFSFYLSERVESSNTARLSFSAASLSLSLHPPRRANDERFASKNSRARSCARATDLAFLPRTNYLPSLFPFPTACSPRSARRCARETVNSLDRPDSSSKAST